MMQVVAELQRIRFVVNATNLAQFEEVAAVDLVLAAVAEGLAHFDPCFGTGLADMVKGEEMLL